MSANGSDPPPQGDADTIVSPPRRRATDLQAETPAGLGDSSERSGDELERAAVKAKLRARMFAIGSEAPKIGRYAVLEVLGVGGMGTVYAVYDDELDRRVALKLMKASDGDDARQRMLREAQAMAKLSHPNVVPVFEVGEHEGQLFVVMEYVKGVTLRRWRNDEDRSWSEVLDKYLQAGLGLAAAHAQGIVHRDFKPQNAVVGEDGRVRVLDFGLAAKPGEGGVTSSGDDALPSPRDEALVTPLTEAGTVVGTPAYMSPEQFSGRGVDHRSDQFSFCVALWEALYWSRPFGNGKPVVLLERIASGDYTEPGQSDAPAQLRTLLERGLKPTADERWADLPELLGALEAIATSEPKPGRRAGRFVLAAVVIAGLAGVIAVPPILRSRAQARCDRDGQQITTTWNESVASDLDAAFAATGSPIAAPTGGRVRDGLTEYADAWTTAKVGVCRDASIDGTRDERELAAAGECLSFASASMTELVSQFREADLEVLDKAVAAIARLPKPQRCSDARWLAENWVSGDRGVAAREEILQLRIELGAASQLSPLGKHAEADERIGAVLARAQDAEYSALAARARVTLGGVQRRQAQTEAARANLRQGYFEALALGEEHVALRAAVDLATLTAQADANFDRATDWADNAQLLVERLGLEDQLEASWAANARGTVHAHSGDYEGAVVAFQSAATISALSGGGNRRGQVIALNNVGHIQRLRGRYDESLEAYTRALTIVEELLGSEHASVADTLGGLGNVHFNRGEHDQARQYYERALALVQTRFGPDHVMVAFETNNLANALSGQGHYEDALALYKRALRLKEQRFGPGHPEVATGLSNVGAGYSELADWPRAKEAYERALAIRADKLPADHPRRAESLLNLGSALSQMGELEEGLALAIEAAEIFEKAHGDPHPRLAMTLHTIGEIRIMQGREDLATDPLRRSVAIQTDIPGTGSALASYRFALARAIGPTDPEEAAALAAQARSVYVRLADTDAVAEIDDWQLRLAQPG